MARDQPVGALLGRYPRRLRRCLQPHWWVGAGGGLRARAPWRESAICRNLQITPQYTTHTSSTRTTGSPSQVKLWKGRPVCGGLSAAGGASGYGPAAPRRLGLRSRDCVVVRLGSAGGPSLPCVNGFTRTGEYHAVLTFNFVNMRPNLNLNFVMRTGFIYRL